MVAIAPGDFLGLFPRAASVHRSEANESCPWAGVKTLVRLFGGDEKAEQDHGTMMVATSGEVANVCLAWKGVNEVKVTCTSANI